MKRKSTLFITVFFLVALYSIPSFAQWYNPITWVETAGEISSSCYEVTGKAIASCWRGSLVSVGTSRSILWIG